jgi:hypothetical protein
MSFPLIGSQIITEPGSPEDFRIMEVKNVSRDSVTVTAFLRISKGQKSAFRFARLHPERRHSSRHLIADEGAVRGGSAH